jgi:undecaprenyl-diphosphatase
MNYSLFQAINGLAGHNGALDAFMEFVATDGIFVLLAALAVFWLLPSPLTPRALERRLVVYAVVVALVGLLLNVLIGALWVEARPGATHHITALVTGANDASFPSDHATLAFGLALPVAWRRRDWGIPLLAGALLLAFARVYVGRHYPGDVLGSLALALLLTALIWQLRGLLEKPIELLLGLLARLRLASEADVPYPAALAG